MEGKKQKYGYGNFPEISIEDVNRLHVVGRRLVELGRYPGEVLDSLEPKRMILAGHSLIEVEAKLDKDKERAALAARMTFGEAATRYKAEWVDKNWKAPDNGFSPVRLHLLPKLSGLPSRGVGSARRRPGSRQAP